ncbi:hypothetical protein SOVF_114660 [Spinacia oleracea]|nr:uncharacterized protein LOC110779984 [Spinacia oleracea]KNA13658.1 hypothetical protein SOVF_114660 [Spinacia oleracea]
MGFSKFAVFALFMLAASAVIDAKYEARTTASIMTEQLLEAEVKALASLREVERGFANSKLKQNLMMRTTEDKCSPSGAICSGFGPPEQCCSGACVPHPILRIFVCQ